MLTPEIKLFKWLFLIRFQPNHKIDFNLADIEILKMLTIEKQIDYIKKKINPTNCYINPFLDDNSNIEDYQIGYNLTKQFWKNVQANLVNIPIPLFSLTTNISLTHWIVSNKDIVYPIFNIQDYNKFIKSLNKILILRKQNINSYELFIKLIYSKILNIVIHNIPIPIVHNVTELSVAKYYRTFETAISKLDLAQGYDYQLINSIVIEKEINLNKIYWEILFLAHKINNNQFIYDLYYDKLNIPSIQNDLIGIDILMQNPKSVILSIVDDIINLRSPEMKEYAISQL
jgi:hypothetical protein